MIARREHAGIDIDIDGETRASPSSWSGATMEKVARRTGEIKASKGPYKNRIPRSS